VRGIPPWKLVQILRDTMKNSRNKSYLRMRDERERDREKHITREVENKFSQIDKEKKTYLNNRSFNNNKNK
jgi:hypothetical protein